MTENRELALLTSFGTYAEAKNVQVLLDNANIKNMIQPTAVGGVMEGQGSGAGPHNIFVPENDLQKAKEILNL